MKIFLQLFFVLLVLFFSSCSEEIIDEGGIGEPKIIGIELQKYIDLENTDQLLFNKYEKLLLTKTEKSLDLFEYNFSGNLITKSCAMEFTNWEAVEQVVPLEDFEVSMSSFYTCIECKPLDKVIIIYTEEATLAKKLEQGVTPDSLIDLMTLLESEYDRLWPCN